MTKECMTGFIFGLSTGYALAYFIKAPANRLDSHRELKQPVKTQGTVAKDTHQGVQAGRRAAVGATAIDREGTSGAGS